MNSTKLLCASGEVVFFVKVRLKKFKKRHRDREKQMEL